MKSQDYREDKVREWARHSLSLLGYTPTVREPETVQETPWSRVSRFLTTEGAVYLKQTPPSLAIEVPILHLLREHFGANVPEVVAHHAQWSCFLMKDAGETLRTLLKKQFDVSLFCRAIETFTTMQLRVAPEVQRFLDIGVPDWRLNRFPELYMQLLAQEDVLLADGLSEKDIDALKALQPEAQSLCKRLAEYPMAHTLVQPDFNDNNAVLNRTTHAITIIDLGEISISHPFFSLLNGLKQAEKHYGVRDGSAAFHALLNASFSQYSPAVSPPELHAARALAERLFPVYQSLAFYRLLTACDPEKIMATYPGRLRAFLQAWMTSAKD